MKTVKKMVAIVITVVVMLSCVACGSEKGEDGGLTLKKGVLQVGMEVGYPPMEFLDEDGKTIIGFDKEVADAIGEKLGLKVEFIDTAWDGIFSSLDSDRYDCIISAVSITDERKAKYSLTEPYIANKLVLVTAKGSDIKTPEDCAGKAVAVQTETTADDYMKDLQDKGLKLDGYFPYDKVIQCFDDLALGRVDAVLVDNVVARFYMTGNYEGKYDVVWESDESEPMGICMKKGNDDLTKKIETAVDELYKEGKISTIATKYFGIDITEGVR